MPRVRPRVGRRCAGEDNFVVHATTAEWGRPGRMDLGTMLLAATLDLSPTGPGLHFVDVGQGSALLVVGPEGHAVMIDSGPPGAAEAVVHALDEHALLRVDLWIHTHLDADHIGGVARVIAGSDGVAGSADDIEVEVFWDRGLDGAPTTDAVAAYEDVAGDRRRQATAGDRWEVQGLRIGLVDTGAPEVAAENARGLALCLEVGELKLLAPGDLPAAQAAVAAAACGRVDLLWAAHHGGADGTSEALLAAADPALVIVSAGRDNPYCHPAAVTMARLWGHTVWMTGLAGAGPLGACPPLATSFAAEHHVVSGDLWFPAGG